MSIEKAHIIDLSLESTCELFNKMTNLLMSVRGFQKHESNAEAQSFLIRLEIYLEQETLEHLTKCPTCIEIVKASLPDDSEVVKIEMAKAGDPDYDFLKQIIRDNKSLPN